MDLGNFGFDFRFGNILKDLERFERLSKTHLVKYPIHLLMNKQNLIGLHELDINSLLAV